MDFPQLEQKILKFWQDNRIFEKLRKKIQGKKRWSFLDGPITANNPMGVHHAWGRTYKDVFQRYRAMRGFDQRFQNGFDCQGLWVEVEVEKELGFKTKKDIERFGIDKFVEKCKERVWKYSKIQTEQSVRLGQWMDWENSYYTMSDENNYAIWHFLKKCKKDGLLYKGRDVVPWCPRCGTAISQHEILTEEYKEISHQTIYFKLPASGKNDTYFLAWTTTPWTLPANVALAVHPDLEYVKIEDKSGKKYILLKEKADLIKEGKIIETFAGKDLDGEQYEGMFEELPAVRETMNGQKHKVVLWDEVSGQEGTGIVHIAPGCGQEDFQLGKEFDLPVIDPVDEESRYKEGFDFLSGKLVTEVNDLIFENLKRKNLVYKIEDYLHRYPTCWRCKSELIFRLVDEWYISMAKLRKRLVAVTQKIKWIPSFGLERELDWLKNMQDWLISKKRYWGLALPIFECGCGNFEVMGSREELKKRAVEGWREFEGHTPHRPWVDKVKIKCPKCGELVSRIADVGNPWLDAGIVSFSTMKYFEDKSFWRKWFPADFICESFPGQFKNWFYSLIVMATVLENKNPSKTIFGFASVRDEKGEEMHKSKGNAIEFNEAAEKIGAEVMRWMYVRQNPAFNLNFGWKAGKESERKLLTLWNSFVFLKTYFDKKELALKTDWTKNGSLLDKWIVSRLNNVILTVGRSLDRYDAAAGSSAIENFFTEDLSLWYVRRSRRRFQKPESKREKEQAVSVLFGVLLDLVKAASPLIPFLTEEIYQSLKTKEMPESVHLCDWPEINKKLIDSSLEEKMKKVREIVNLGLKERARLGLKVRQPLSELAAGDPAVGLEPELTDLIKEELNVKSFRHDPGLKGEIKLDATITAELRQEGQVREIIRHVQELRKQAGLTPADKISIYCSGDNSLKRVMEENKKLIMKETLAEALSALENIEKEVAAKKEIEIDAKKLRLGISRR
jgi:isoleucyl-tRNA synthetase